MNDLPPLSETAPRVVELCEASAAKHEFTTYWVGVRVKPRADLPADDVIAWKSALKRQVGAELGDRWEPLGRLPEFRTPQMLMIYDLQSGEVERKVRSALVYGRYRKLVRGLPQTRARWRCPLCNGPGCEVCQGTGRRYPVSLEDLLGRSLSKAFRAKNYQLHGLGREDVDVRCLGTGRPFVLELQRPRRRLVDLEEAARDVVAGAAGQLELPVGLQHVSDEGVVARLKGWEADKEYRALCELTGEGEEVSAAAVAELAERFGGVVLQQRTPARVARRRADKVRQRRVASFEPRFLDERHFEARLKAQSGTYIKELISGDDGRTIPSVAEALGVACVCAELDVLEIHVSDQELLGD